MCIRIIRCQHDNIYTKKIENNILEGMTYRFYILLSFDFIFDFNNKQKKCYGFKLCLICFETIFRQINMSFPQKYYSPSFLYVMDDFTLRLLKNIYKKRFCIHVVCPVAG